MKQHPHNALTALKVKNIKEPGSYADGNGLYLKVDKSGAKRWIQRITVNSKRCDLGLGSLRDTSLSEAREKALINRKTARAGGDPIADKRKAQGLMSFEEAAYKVYEIHLPTWSNEKQAQQWINTLKTYVFPHIGRKRMDVINSSDILHVLTPIWTSKTETASRVKQRIGTIMKWAIAQGWRDDNPIDSIASALPKKSKNIQHHKSLPYQDVSKAISSIRESNASEASKLAIEMLVLTALRSGEVRNAKWGEIDLAKKVWTVPGERMKKRKEHRVPLSSRCIEILAKVEQLIDKNDKNTPKEQKLIFPSLNTGKAISDVTFSKLLKDLKVDCVPHGFRSSFRMWAGEKTNIPREVCEFALAHVVGDEAERAYQRSDLFDKRRKLMEMWQIYLSTNQANIIKIAN